MSLPAADGEAPGDAPRAGHEAASSDLLAAPLRVVVFLVDSRRPSTASGGYRWAHTGQALLPLFCDSVARLHPHARFVILTSPSTDLPVLRYPTEVVARPVEDRPLLYERMRHYIAYLEDAPDDATVLFMESDMLLWRRFDPPAVGEWDLALAYKSTGMWINSGMVLVRRGRRDRAVAFLRRALALYEAHHVNHPKWGADQAALRDALALTAPPEAPRVQVTADARVLLIPRHRYTRFTSWPAAVFPPSTWILHFSGDRKKWMRLFHWLRIGR